MQQDLTLTVQQQFWQSNSYGGFRPAADLLISGQKTVLC
jgi:hypothetical protein